MNKETLEIVRTVTQVIEVLAEEVKNMADDAERIRHKIETMGCCVEKIIVNCAKQNDKDQTEK